MEKPHPPALRQRNGILRAIPFIVVLRLENGIALILHRMIVDARQVGLLDEEIVHEELASHVDENYRGPSLAQVRYRELAPPIRRHVPRRPRLRQLDTIRVTPFFVTERR